MTQRFQKQAVSGPWLSDHIFGVVEHKSESLFQTEEGLTELPNRVKC